MSLGALLKGAIALGFARWNPTATALVHPVTGEDYIRAVASYTWATRPSAASNTGVTIRITNYGGTAGSLWISDGTYWKPHGGHLVLKTSAAGLSSSQDGVDTTLVTQAIPAGMLGSKGRIRVTHSWVLTGTGNKVLRVKFGATEFFNITQTTILSGRWMTEFQNRDATNSQVGGTGSGNSSFGPIAGALVTAAVDTTADVDLKISGSAADGTNTCQLAAYSIELLTE